MSDVDVIDDLVFALLEQAARKLCVPSWPQASPPAKSPDVPVIEARRDDDGVLGVFRFATVVADGASARAHFEVTLAEALKRGDVSVGDGVGVELPLPVLCAIALADVDAGALPHDVDEDLTRSGMKSAVVARLSLLRGPPPSSPALSELRALVTRHGADVVRWTMSVQPRRAADAADDAEGAADHDPQGAPQLVCCVVHHGTARLVVIDAVGGEGGEDARRRLLQAIAPPPGDDSGGGVRRR